jgi:hypothetical protein
MSSGQPDGDGDGEETGDGEDDGDGEDSGDGGSFMAGVGDGARSLAASAGGPASSLAAAPPSWQPAKVANSNIQRTGGAYRAPPREQSVRMVSKPTPRRRAAGFW